MDPFYRYAGGKRWLSKGIAEEIAPLQPEVYVEPFLGGGAVALKVEAKRYLLGDANDAIISLWQQAIAMPRALHLRARSIEQQFGHTLDGYKEATRLLNEHRRVGRTRDVGALTLYLLAHGYNGLWRENQAGKYNVPFGKEHQKRFRYPKEEILIEVSRRFRGCSTLFPDDFELLVDLAPKGSVLYADPPYVGTFDQYTPERFGEIEQRRLAAALHRAARRGVRVFASNTYHPLVHEIYAWASIEDVSERWSVGSKGSQRGKAACVLIRS